MSCIIDVKELTLNEDEFKALLLSKALKYYEGVCFTKDYLIRYYPDSNKRSEHRLISLSALIDEIGDIDIVAGWIKRAEKNRYNTHFDKYTRCKLRRGIEVVFCLR